MAKRFKISQIFINFFLILVSLTCIIPFLLLFMASITDENAIVKYGYSLIPHKISFYAYEYLQSNAFSILRAYGITIFVTVIGTVCSLLIMALLAYPLSRKGMPFSKTITFIVFFTLLFNGGLVPTYLVYTRVFNLNNNVFALIVPYLLVRAFYVLLMRTFFTMTIPESLIESATIDGAGEWYIFFKIVSPLALPVLATVGLFQTVNYWNDWFNGFIFLTNTKLYSIQVLLNRILLDIQFLSTNAVSSTGSETAAQLPIQSVRMALAVLGVLPILIAYPFFQKYFVKGLTVGAIKG